MKEKASLSLVRHINSEIVLTYLQRHPNATIPEMSRESKLSLPTVTRTINCSLAIGLVQTTARKGEEKGRKAQCYAFNDDFGCALLLLIKEQRILLQVVTIGGKILHRTQVNIVKDEVLSMLQATIEKQLAAFQNMKCICITLPGHIRDGFVYASHAFPKLNGLDLQNQLAERYKMPVSVMDSVKALPYAGREYDKDFRKKVVLFLSLEVEDGCGAACSMLGKTYPGTTGSFGDLYALPFPFARMTRQQKYMRFAQAMVGMTNADTVVFYGDDSADFNKIIEKLTEELPAYALPKFYVAQGLIHDNFQAMKNIAFDNVLDSIEN